MIRKFLSILITLLLILTACSHTPTSTPTPTATLIPTYTPRPTATPIPEVDLNSFVFPFNVDQTTNLWEQVNVSSRYQYFTYHINSRNSRDIPYEDKCGYHPGDLIMPIGSFTSYEDFLIDVKLPYSGKLVNKWITQGGDDGFTFFLGKSKGSDVYLNVYHTHTSDLSIGQQINQGDIFGSLNYTTSHGDWNEAAIHLTLFNPAPNGGTDFLGDQINLLDLASYALPPMMKAMYINDVNMAIIYEGENWCSMTSSQKIEKILNEILPKAGFCVNGQNVIYCGALDNFMGIEFTQYTLDERTVMLIPKTE